ncbi:DUF2339 domain-containing protein [Bacillus sp. A301a_S52]|nr:DUF2339 domain-containing protein [Bacillus sp. A301a_S52]
MLDEKLNILKVSKEKIYTYFENSTRPEQNHLQELERQAANEVAKLKEKAQHSLLEEKQSVMKKINDLSDEISIVIKEEKEKLANEKQGLRTNTASSYETLASEELTEEVIQKRIKQNQIELKIGLNWINKLGILLIILGVAAAFRYSYATWFNDYAKAGLFSVLGVLMLVGGEWFFRKNKHTFALGIIGGGVAVLYGTIFFSYFSLQIISLIAALLFAIAVTAITLTISLRYESKTICTFGLIGGYLPFYSFFALVGLEETNVYMAMGYVLFLNMTILWMSFHKQWPMVHSISFWLNLVPYFILVLTSPSKIVSMFYAIIIFLLYLTMTISYPFKHKTALKWQGISLLGSNTAFSCLAMYGLFYWLEWDSYTGILAVGFSAFYYVLGRWASRQIPKEIQTKILFYSTSLTFAVLFVPFQFGVMWLALGWLVQSIVIMLYANKHKQRLLEKAGWGIFSLTLTTFCIEVIQRLEGFTHSYFHFKYLAIIIGLVVVMIYYVHDQTKRERTYLFNGFTDFINGYKYFTLINIFIYVLFECFYRYELWVPSYFTHFEFYKWLLFVFICLALAYTLQQIPLLYDRIVGYLCLVLYFLGSATTILVTFSIPALNTSIGDNTLSHYIALIVLIGFNVIVFTGGRALLLAYVRSELKNAELYPTTLAIYFLAILGGFLTVQLKLDDVGFIFSLVYLTVAIGYILYGFKQKYIYMRRIGLGLTLLTTGKLILYDFAYLTEGSKIIAYFSFGVMLLAISYIYQKVASKHLEADKQPSKEKVQ